jgi:hypothetical protein
MTARELRMAPDLVLVLNIKAERTNLVSTTMGAAIRADPAMAAPSRALLVVAARGVVVKMEDRVAVVAPRAEVGVEVAPTIREIVKGKAAVKGLCQPN